MEVLSKELLALLQDNTFRDEVRKLVDQNDVAPQGEGAEERNAVTVTVDRSSSLGGDARESRQVTVRRISRHD